MISLKELREKKGVSTSWVANKIDVNLRTYQRMEEHNDGKFSHFIEAYKVLGYDITIVDSNEKNDLKKKMILLEIERLSTLIKQM